MNHATLRILMSVIFLACLVIPHGLKAKNNPKVIIETSMGNIEVELYKEKAPISVKNFLSYVSDGFYSNTIFHRVIKGFMIQCGGIDTNGKKKATKPPIQNEAKNGLKNDRGTLSFARTADINSATSQFFINLVDNDFLNNGTRDYGYAVFGKVTKGMDVVDKIGKVKTSSGDMPEKPIVILSIKEVLEETNAE